MPKIFNFASLWQTEALGQIVLPDRSILIGQKNGVKCQNEKFNCDILKFMKNVKMVNFASLWQTEAWGQTVLPDR